jgi:ATP/maltotriose-dependent transcriptional regulator MalT
LQGDFVTAEASVAEGLLQAEQVDAPMTLATAHMEIGELGYYSGDYDRAYRAMLTAYRQTLACLDISIAGPQYLGSQLAMLGKFALAQGDVATAEAHLVDSLRQLRDHEFTWRLSDTLTTIGDLARVRGDYDEALARYQESLQLSHSHGDRLFIANTLASVASIAALRQRPERAARLYGISAHLWEELGTEVRDRAQVLGETGEAAVRAALTPDALAAAEAEGMALSVEQAIAEALAEQPNPRQLEPGLVVPAPAFEGLTMRETEVLALLTEGCSDREIAEALFISTRTVNGHVTNLLGKLGVSSRTAAVAYAVRHGIVPSPAR